MEAWALTSLEQHPGRPKVAPWIRGWVEREEPQTAVVWRRLFPLRPGELKVTPDLKAYFEDAAPPHVTETLEAPTWRVVEMLRKRADALRKPQSKRGGATLDVEEDEGAEEGEVAARAADASVEALEPKPLHAPVVVVPAADRTVEEAYGVARLADSNADALARTLAGRTVVVDARLGGLDLNGLLDIKAADLPVTLDQQANGWGLDQALTAGRRITFGEQPERMLKGPERDWKLDEFRWAASDTDEPKGLWVELWRGVGENPGDAAISRVAQALDEHLSETGKHATRIADALGLASPWREVLVAAARAHDLGKDRDLWHNAMGAQRDAGRPYAKTTGGGDGRKLNGYRHEFGSVLDVLADPAGYLGPEIMADADLKDLALHLIAAHHGFARPTIKPYDPAPGEPPSRLEAHAQEVALRFSRLQAKWGPWGLAWWEALLRAADWAASRALNEGEAGEPEAPVAPAREPAHV